MEGFWDGGEKVKLVFIKPDESEDCDGISITFEAEVSTRQQAEEVFAHFLSAVMAVAEDDKKEMN